MRSEKSLQPLERTFGVERFISVSYQDLFLLWLALVAAFGFIYFLLSAFTESHGLAHIEAFDPADKFFSSLYFSVVTATSVGYGDIAPLGISKLFASIQSIMSLFLSAILVTKLISYRQEIALYQVHKLTFQNIFYSTREGFFVIRRDFDHIIDEAKRDHAIAEHLWQNMATAFKQGQNLLEEVLEFYDTDAKMYTIDIRREQLLLEAVQRTLERISEMLEILRAHRIDLLSHAQTTTELKKLIHVVENVMPMWQERSPYQETDTFSEIRTLAKSIESQMMR